MRLNYEKVNYFNGNPARVIKYLDESKFNK